LEEPRAQLIVVDCSTLIAGALPDEVEAETRQLLGELQDGRTAAVVPSLFYQEISNALLIAYRRNRIHRERFNEGKGAKFNLTFHVRCDMLTAVNDFSNSDLMELSNARP